MDADTGQKIRAFRKMLGLSQLQLAEKAQISRDAIGNYERGDRIPTVYNEIKIADALGVNINEFHVGRDTNMNIGNKLQQYRKQKHLTQKELAEKCDLAEITIKQYEAGKYQPNTKNLVKMAGALNVDINDLLSDATNELPEGSDCKQQFHNNKLLKYFDKLNDTGQKKLIELASDLSEIQKYKVLPSLHKGG